MIRNYTDRVKIRVLPKPITTAELNEYHFMLQKVNEHQAKLLKPIK